MTTLKRTPLERHTDSVHAANDVADFLNHVGWEEVLEPEFEKLKKSYGAMLVQSVLGKRISVTAPQQSPYELSKEQIAGVIFGIEFLQSKINEIIRRGTKGREVLSEIGFSVD